MLILSLFSLQLTIPEDQRSCNAHLRPKTDLIYFPSLMLVAYLTIGYDGWMLGCCIPSLKVVGLLVLEKMFEGLLPYMDIAAILVT